MINFSSNNIISSSRQGVKVQNTKKQDVTPQNKVVEQFKPNSTLLSAWTTKTTSIYNPDKSPINQDGSVSLKIGYLNDVHGQYLKLTKIGNALRDCDIRFSGGDNMIGDDRNENVNKCIVKYFDSENFESSAVGNHDVDGSEEMFLKLTQDAKMKYLAANFKQSAASKMSPDAKAGKEMDERIVDSYVGDYKGVKYGVIGVAPCDMKTRMTHPELYTDFEIDDLPKTITEVQKEVDKLKNEDGVNIIFLLSHAGHFTDREIAQETSGVDVIIGGHSHTYVDGVKEGENLFASKTGEPVIITNAEKDGNYFGKLDITFNKDGVITHANNNLFETSKCRKNMIYKKMFDDIIGEPEKLGKIGNVIPAPKQRLTEESAHANFVAKAIREEMGVDIGIVNAGNIRNQFEPGSFDTSDAKSISPFGDGMAIVTINEKDLVDGIKHGCKSVTDKNGKPGLYYAAGLTYSVKKSTGELLEMTYTDREGNQRKIDVNNPDPNKTYRIGADDYILRGGDGATPFNHLDEAEAIFEYSEDKLISDYVKHHNGQPVNIDELGIINVID